MNDYPTNEWEVANVARERRNAKQGAAYVATQTAARLADATAQVPNASEEVETPPCAHTDLDGTLLDLGTMALCRQCGRCVPAPSTHYYTSQEVGTSVLLGHKNIADTQKIVDDARGSLAARVCGYAAPMPRPTEPLWANVQRCNPSLRSKRGRR